MTNSIENNTTDQVHSLSSFDAIDKHWMSYALELAAKAMLRADPNPHVGCVIVRGDDILGQGSTQIAGAAHAEQAALFNANELGNDVTGAKVYVTLEPCAHYGRTSPCAEALINAKVGEVVIATRDPNPRVSGGGIKKLKNAGITVRLGLFHTRARDLNRGFIQRMKSGRPFVIAKMAVSADGRSALEGGISSWVSNSDSRADVQKLRCTMSAILSTAKTVIADNPRLTARDPLSDELVDRQPLRVLLDPHGELLNTAKTFHEPGYVLLIVAQEKRAQTDAEFSQLRNVEIIDLPLKDGHFNLREVFEQLGQHEINNVLIEAGARFQGVCVESGLVNELRVYVAPHLMGGSRFGILELSPLNDMKERRNLELRDVKKFGQDVRLIYRL